MAAIERDFRRGTRIVRMDIRTRFRKRSKFGPPFDREPNQRTLWGVFSTRRERTDLLYVFSGPGRLAGTTLLMHDYIAMDRVDAMWVYLRAFDIFEKIGARTEQLFVPGTALSYEDSRGFISTARFEFFSSDPPTDTAGAEGRAGGPAARNVWIRACPRSLAIAKQLGYSALLLNADRDKRIVRRVEYFDLSGRMFKTYTLLEESAVGDRHFAAKVELEHYANGFLTTIEYEHWQPDRAPLRTLFEPSVDSESFLDRLGAYVGEAGPGVRLEAELALADEQSREFEARLRRIKEETVNRLKDSTRKAGD